LLEKIKCPKQQLLSKDAAVEYLVAEKPEVLLVLGAGDIDRLVEPIRKGWMS
jgi:UDP-N-acetylmuramate--alanine ligase